jgi:hypothetical protein
MLWYKSWLETRWRFLIGLALILCSAAGSVWTYPQVVKLLPLVPTNIGGIIGDRIREAAVLARSYDGFVWSHWFRQNLSQLTTLFAVVLGTAGVLSPSGGALFTLSLPVSRQRLLAVRAATGLAELLALAFIPSLLIPLLSPAIGQHYSVTSVLVHGICLFIAVSVFFGLAFLLSTIFNDMWRPLLIALAIAIVLSLIDQLYGIPGYSIYHVMSGESYFRSGQLPWGGLLASIAISAAFYYGAVATLARRDF